jgi:hypothetical protein
VFGSEKKEAWIALRSKLLNNEDGKEIWDEILGLLDKRLNTRYFIPIRRILLTSKNHGEGFAVMILICSLIEFLQTLEEGKYFNKDDNDKNDYRYGLGKSRDHYTRFLTQKTQFKAYFSKKNINGETYAEDFYSNVRCGLLHEAATSNGWVIRASKYKPNSDFVDLSNDPIKIIYRDLFFAAIKKYIEGYKKQVKDGDVLLRNALCRKFDKLCEIEIKDEVWWNTKV